MAKPKLPKLNTCRKRNGPCLNLFVVWYQPFAGISARHWSLFLSGATDAAQVHGGAIGTIYEVIDERAFPHLKPNRLPDIVASIANRYEGAKLVTKERLTLDTMDQYFHVFKDNLVEDIGDHNGDKKNIVCQSNCQHWVKALAAQIDEHSDFSNVPM
ncbi:hypothetical protein FPV67DRAFT_1529548 [Lyophyllum atratum]|nr:hypothetical protein FPV67DRAFT_1529548 [Lyophyllum atratum]